MTQIDWLKQEINRLKEILNDLERGVSHYRGVVGQAPIDTTEEYKADVESRLTRNMEILEILEKENAERT